MKHTLRLAAFALLVALIAFPVSAAFAHGHVEVGDYEIVIGFHNEPAYQSDLNGIEFFVTNTKTEEPVMGLEDTLQLEITYGASTRELPVSAQWGQDGAYIGYVIPTEAGDYTAHIWGTIEGTPVDVSMTSSPETFGSIKVKGDIAFPQAEVTSAELKAQADTATQQAATAAQSAQTALIVGIVGAVLGVIGIGVGVVGMQSKKA
jgi:hypothetical protein